MPPSRVNPLQRRAPRELKGKPFTPLRWMAVGLVLSVIRLAAVGAPILFNVTNTSPVEGNPVWVTAAVTDVVSVTSVTLVYSLNAAPLQTNTVFLETMATNSGGISPWTGTGADNAWIVSCSGTNNPFSQITNSNVGGNPCVLQFAKGTATLSDSLITTAGDINATGSAAFVEFYLKTANLSSGTGWTFQLDAGTGFGTRLSDVTGSNHSWQLYHYDLPPGERVPNLTLRFQFAGGANTNKIFLDQISVVTVTGGSPWTNVAMADDGLHGDGAAGDGIYGGLIPGFPAGATVNYFVTAADLAGGAATNPAAAPSATLSYTVAPTVSYDLMLGRPTDSSIAVNVLANRDLQIYFQYGLQSGMYTGQTATRTLSQGVPLALALDSLQNHQRYYYRLSYSTNSGATFSAGTEHSFMTQRARGGTFTFDIDADPHYGDYGTGGGGVADAVWKQTYTNILADQPDFLVDLGDTFMGEKLCNYYGITNALSQASLQFDCADARSRFFSILGHSVSLFLANGNHDPELGWMLTNSAPQANPAVWAAAAREQYYACPVPGGFYSGATNVDYYQQQPRDGYYAFEWGDALFVMLDPFWYSYQAGTKSSDPWGWTLGANQYFWLKTTLESSSAKYKFVFAHHLIGGSWDTAGRGGLEFSPYFEWGGLNTNGTPGFAAHRPGWPMPIRDLLLTNHVQAFFHGHDHLYCKQDYYANGRTNGAPDLIYQEVPQPSHYPYDSYSYASGTNSGYNYQSGVFFGSSGHLRVTVSPAKATVDYVRSYAPGYPPANPGAGITNRMVSYRYDIPAAPVLSAAIATNNLVLQWSAQSGFNYFVQWSSDLMSWSNVSVGPTNTWTETNPLIATPQKFYRLMW